MTALDRPAKMPVAMLVRLPAGKLAIALSMAALLVSAPLFLDDFLLKFLTRILIFGLAALAVDLVLGYAGLVSLGHAAFLGIGAYVAGILTQAGWESAFLVWPVAALAAGACALVIGALSLRSSGLYFIMITLAFAQMVYYAMQSLSAYGGDDGFAMSRNTFGNLIQPYDDVSFYYVTLAIVAAIAGLVRFIAHSQFGTILQASRDNDLRLAALGVNSFGYRLIAFAISGVIAGLAGALLANLTGYIVPTLASWQLSGELLVMVLMGASGIIAGPFIGAAALLGLSEVLSEMTTHWMFYLGILIVMRALFLRKGLFAALLRQGRRS